VLSLDYDGPLDIHVREHGGDDHQFEILREVAATAPSERPVTLTRGENVGFAVGHNMAMRESTSELVLLVNADATLAPDFLVQGLPAFDDPRVGAVQAKLLRPADETGPTGRPMIDTAGMVASRQRLFSERGHGEEDAGGYDCVAEVFGADGAVPIYRRAALDDVAIPLSLGADRSRDGVEYFDETFFIYKEDVDLAWRLQHRAWKTLYVPSARACHVRTMRGGSGGALTILAQRRKLPAMGRKLSFGNQRLTLIKNDSPRALLRDARPWLPKELASWGVVFSEGIGPGAVRRLVRLTPSALRKRRWIRAHRHPDADPERWFE
jgi:GT2 family glycosyltransferase